MSKQPAVLFGPVVGELFWEIFRFYPVVPYLVEKKYSKYDDLKIIVFTRRDRFDIYGKYADILTPLELDEKKCVQDCFALRGYPNKELENLIKFFRKKYEKKYDILEHLYPSPTGKKSKLKNQFPRSKMKFKFRPRNENKKLLDKYIPNNKKIIILAPRFRKGLKRNWPYFQELYNLIQKDCRLMSNYNFVICGKYPDYIPDKNENFYDINDIELGQNSSLIGLTFELLNRENTILTVGSQSAIPNISLLFGKRVLEWGHQRILHTKSYNIFKTKVDFIDDKDYNKKPDVIFNKLKKII